MVAGLVRLAGILLAIGGPSYCGYCIMQNGVQHNLTSDQIAITAAATIGGLLLFAFGRIIVDLFGSGKEE